MRRGRKGFYYLCALTCNKDRRSNRIFQYIHQNWFRRVCREIDDNIEFIFDYTCLYRYRLEEVVSTEADTMKQIETELVAA